MIRIIVRTDDAAMAANVGGAVHPSFRCFDYDLPALEEFLRNKRPYTERSPIGVEVLDDEYPPTSTPRHTMPT